MDVPGRREPAHRSARRGVHRPRPPRSGAGALRPAGPPHRDPSPRSRGTPRAARLPDPARAHRRHRRQRRGLQPLRRSRPASPRSRRELEQGGFDVVHVHEPVAPLIGWDTPLSTTAPVVGTFHAYSTKALPNHAATLLGARRVFNKLSARIAVSEAAAWTGRRWFGGEYEIVPNGVDVAAAPQGPKPPSEELRITFVGRPEERKGLPVLLTALGGLVEHVPARLTVIGAEEADITRYLPDPELMEAIDARGRVSGEELWAALHDADVLCAPSLSGESFGMVLTEAFAAGTPVIASEIAGYSDVVTDGVDGVLVPPADAQRLAEELQRAHHEPERLAAMGEAARRSAERYAWPRVADEVGDVYEKALEAPAPVNAADSAARRVGLVRADGGPRRPARRLPSLDPEPEQGRGAQDRAPCRPRRRRRGRHRPDRISPPTGSASTGCSRASSAPTSPGC